MNVDTPATEILSKFVCPSTSKSLVTDVFPLDAILSLCVPAVSNVIVSAEGKEIFVSASPLC